MLVLLVKCVFNLSNEEPGCKKCFLAGKLVWGTCQLAVARDYIASIPRWQTELQLLLIMLLMFGILEMNEIDKKKLSPVTWLPSDLVVKISIKLPMLVADYCATVS